MGILSEAELTQIDNDKPFLKNARFARLGSKLPALNMDTTANMAHSRRKSITPDARVLLTNKLINRLEGT